MATTSFLASFYFVCGVIIFFLAVTILRHSGRSIVNWSTALVLFFAGFGPILGAMGVLLEQNISDGTYLFKSLIASFDYIWEFFFPALVLFALVHPVRHRLWRYLKKWSYLLFLPHLFHLVFLIFVVDRVNPDKLMHSISNLDQSAGMIAGFLQTTSNVLDVFLGLLFKAHMHLFSLVNISYAGFSMLLLGRSLGMDVAPRVRRQLKIVIIGLGVCIFTYSFARVVPIFMGTDLPENLATIFINASLIIGGGSIAYVIVRYQFLDLRLIARRGILYAAAAAVFASIYLLTIRKVTGFFYQYTGRRVEILETGFIILFIIAFQPVLGRLEEWAEKILVREENNPRVRVRDLSSDLLSMVDLESIRDRIKAVLSEVFSIKRVDLVLAHELNESKEHAEDCEKVISTLFHIGEPIKRADFLEAMGYRAPGGSLLHMRGRKEPEGFVNSLTPCIKWFAGYDLVSPVVHEGECIGVLLLGSHTAHKRYTAEEQALISMLTSQIAASLAKIELLKEVVEKRVLEEELNIARAIQINLLPSTPPLLEDYEISALSLSSKQVGGDYYDFIHRGDLVAVAVADVSGKGVPASLLMASLQASLRANMDRMDNPVGVVKTLNDVMCDSTAPDKFATLFYGCLDLKRHVFRFSNAGHVFPALVRDGGTVEILDYSGLILGVQPGFLYEGRDLKFRPGDTLVILTDGVTEAENQDGELFGEDRLYRLLSSLKGQSAFRVKEGIVDTIQQFTYPKGFNDDLTILILKRKE
jgi:serine phosphatase RsbU (regulator of sigma subunit)